MARVFSLKSFLENLLVTISWVMRVYIILVKVCEKAHSKSSRQRVSWVTRDLAYVSNDSRNPAWQRDFSNSSMCFSHGFSWVGTNEPVVNPSSSQNLDQSLTHNSYIKSHKKYREMIEHKYNQIWHRIKASKKIVVGF